MSNPESKLGLHEVHSWPHIDTLTCLRQHTRHLIHLNTEITWCSSES